MKDNIKEGYKDSALGVIPDSWEVVKLGDICDVRDGTHDSPKYVDDGIPFVTSKNLTDTCLNFDDIRYISRIDHENFSKRSKVENGDILFGMIGTVGKPVIVNSLFDFSIKNVALLKFVDNKFLINIFVLNVLKSNIIESQFRRISNGGVLGFVALGQIRGLNFILPVLKEQKQIAEILSTVDKKIDIVEQQIKEIKELKKGLMQKLLVKGIGHTKFIDSPLGQIPHSWEVDEIRNVTSYVDYRGKTPEKVKSGVTLVTSRNIKGGRIKYYLSKEYILREQYSQIMSRGLPKIGDVLITTEAPLGEVASVDREDVALAQRIIKYCGYTDIVNNSFLKYMFMGPSFQELLIKESTGSTVKGIKGSRLHKLKIMIPPLKEQKRIAEILTTVDDKIDILEKKRSEIKDLKKGLMQQLLTGKIRVNIN